MMEEIIIRRYKDQDRSFIRNIAWDTAFIGDSASIFFSSKDILADFLTSYFTDYEPESCFVAEHGGKVVGYLIGAKSVRKLNRIFQLKILLRLLGRFIFKGVLFKKKDTVFILNCLMSLLRQEFKMPDFLNDYPATLHINLDKDWRNLHAGSRLISAYLDYLTEEQIKGVHLATMSSNAAEFFKKQGFVLLYEGKRSYYRYLLHKDIPIYILGKKLLF